ncbi:MULTISPECIES: YwaF family protein [Sutcliffiella]|uniref:TIGR02206 family membrane protein n=1 Tax=Sutcliffiella cohnii TaxID=33932 RepID=A0A223KQ68_9BACI|nr:MULTISPECIES: TIGR02206 family membrane protein [Sutcliffiella]AST91517.1 hypothetical protein BC6307_09595 [Sutcliffiella cohnii]WBL17348.1 TIGR02206 family membrane protein [Sutcliffiella sp. NC1]
MLETFLDPYNVLKGSLIFSTTHIFVLIIILLAVVALYLFRNSPFITRYVRWFILFLLIISELSLNVWYLSMNVWNVKDTLPLQLCSISLYLCCWMMLTKQKIILEVVYFLGIGGAIQALLTPELFYGFPHFRFIQFFLAHSMIILAILYMIWVEKYRISFSSLWKAFISLQCIALIVYVINIVTGGNYMFLMGKPANPTLLDMLGPYPIYIIFLELVVFIIFLLLYLPFRMTKKYEEKRLSHF